MVPFRIPVIVSPPYKKASSCAGKVKQYTSLVIISLSVEGMINSSWEQVLTRDLQLSSMLVVSFAIQPRIPLHLLSPLRQQTKSSHNNLVSEPNTGLSPMSSDDPTALVAATAQERDHSAKIDQILARLSTLNHRLDSHCLRISRTEKFKTGGTTGEVMASQPHPLAL